MNFYSEQSEQENITFTRKAAFQTCHETFAQGRLSDRNANVMLTETGIKK